VSDIEIPLKQPSGLTTAHNLLDGSVDSANRYHGRKKNVWQDVSTPIFNADPYGEFSRNYLVKRENLGDPRGSYVVSQTDYLKDLRLCARKNRIISADASGPIGSV
jgi:hypothetical protein